MPNREQTRMRPTGPQDHSVRADPGPGGWLSEDRGRLGASGPCSDCLGLSWSKTMRGKLGSDTLGPERGWNSSACYCRWLHLKGSNLPGSLRAVRSELLPGKYAEQHLAHVKCLFNQKVYLNLTGLQQGSQADRAPGMLGGC